MKPEVMSMFLGMVEIESLGYFLYHKGGLSFKPLFFLHLKYELACSVSKPVESNKAILLFSFVSLRYIFIKEAINHLTVFDFSMFFEAFCRVV